MKSTRRRSISPDVIRRYFASPAPTPVAPPKTLTEYMDPARFPLTALPDPSPREQFLTDAQDLWRLRQYLADGGALTDHWRSCLTELEVKEVARPALLAQLLAPAG